MKKKTINYRISQLASLLILLVILLVCVNKVYSQTAQVIRETISLKVENQTIEYILKQIEKKTPYRFVYSTDEINDQRLISIDVRGEELMKVLEIIFSDDGAIIHMAGKKLIISRYKELDKQEEVKQTKTIAFGTLKGKVIDFNTNEPLPGATVILKGTTKGGATDFKGEYQINLVPEGKQVFIVSYLGYVAIEESIEIEANKVNILNFNLVSDNKVLGEVVVKGNLEGQEKALNQQRASDNIKNIISADLIGRFPDLNVAEALQRVPGINIERDRGEGGEVQMRGAPPSFTTVNVNGEQIPGSQSEGQRNQELSVIPVDQLSSIEVTKAITPDMDGDNIGGTIDLKTPIAKGLKLKGKVELGGGYNNIIQRLNAIGRASFNQRFFATDKITDGKLGISIGGSYFATDNGRDRTQYSYPANYTTASDGKQYVLPVYYRLRDLENIRTRTGFSATTDYKFNEKNRLTFNYMYSRRFDSDNEKRSQFDFNRGTPTAPQWEIEAGEGLPNINRSTVVRRFINPRTFDVRTNTFTLEGVHQSRKLIIDYILFSSTANNEDNKGRSYDFRTSPLQARLVDYGTDFLNVVARNPEVDINNPFIVNSFRSYSDRNTIVKAQNRSAKINFGIPFQLNENNGIIKFGTKYRNITSTRRIEFDERDFVNDGTVNTTSLFASVLSGREDQQFLRGRVRFGPTINPSLTDQFINANASLFQRDEQSNLNQSVPQFYDANEEVIAGYGMAKLNIKKFMFLAGLRYERTNVTYKAFAYETSDGSNVSSGTISEVAGNRSFDFLLPNFHIKYSIDPLTILRAALTYSFARSSFVALAPTQRISVINQEIDLGNPDLLPARSTNFDIMFEKFLKNVGIISGGVFYKKINDFNFNRNFVGQRTVSIRNPNNPNETQQVTLDFTIEQPQNGEVADLYGAEVNIQANLDFLPGILSGIGIYANYTYTHSKASTFDRKNIRLPGQATHTGNFALSYDWKGFSARAALNFNGGVIRSLGPVGTLNSNDFDTWRADRYQLDLQASYNIGKGFRVYAEFINLTNRPELEYFGIRSRPSNIEYYDWWNRFGVSYSF
ncbi:TonB-dependent receptor [Thermoflexibacter ruber]|uniref:TonB-dependent receptor n=1 Tax=Thermoflexibacter ruber TaxID=1003 RepID=A0A1I2JI25_9BACT|nr:TonB-dependent receptor [Thermoflexibacter ruber]SFF52827.1 TonB-dependent receptor [Thermoflexibacter ruber]